MRVDSGLPEQPSVRVVEAVADEEDVPATELDCLLTETIDPQALDDLFRRGTDGSTLVRVRFAYCGYTVTVASNGTVHIE